MLQEHTIVRGSDATSVSPCEIMIARKCPHDDNGNTKCVHAYNCEVV